MGSIIFSRDGTSLVFPEPQHGNEENWDHNQRIGETDAGRTFAEDPGHTTIRFRWSWIGVSDAKKRELETFEDVTLEKGRLTFDMSWANPWPTLIERTIFSGMTVDGGTTIYSGMTLDAVTIYSGQEYGPDNLIYLTCKFVGGRRQWQNSMNWTWHIERDILREVVDE
jgi:hypothetical protein